MTRSPTEQLDPMLSKTLHNRYKPRMRRDGVPDSEATGHYQGMVFRILRERTGLISAKAARPCKDIQTQKRGSNPGHAAQVRVPAR